MEEVILYSYPYFETFLRLERPYVFFFFFFFVLFFLNTFSSTPPQIKVHIYTIACDRCAKSRIICLKAVEGVDYTKLASHRSHLKKKSKFEKAVILSEILSKNEDARVHYTLLY